MGYDLAGWGDLFVCAGGAAAALSGLIFVGLSVNIRTVLDLDRTEGHDFLIGRALEALVALLLVLAVSVVALTPALPVGVLASVVLFVAVLSAVSPKRALRASSGRARLPGGTFTRVVMAIALSTCWVVGGVTLLTGVGGGLYWLPAAFVLAIAVAAVNAWVLLVEVRR